MVLVASGPVGDLHPLISYHSIRSKNH
jgi:hypothetical protein